ncbi:amidohydrolase family protein [Sphingomonas sp. MMSM20]|uniref:amidohydrolase family protein n=1 Tax=Sphingomonas lycopersici TaxID=2951807 RepID=UPI002238F86F|nr:amidohydrolase family protein [Sphingomonas lycopersici]MCW6530798.1 amidohydrolase family protein [Sphingomonas lycopersici]
MDAAIQCGEGEIARFKLSLALLLGIFAVSSGGGEGNAAPTDVPPWRVDPNPSTYVPPARTDLLIRHATILDGAGRKIVDGDILLRDRKVVAVGEGLSNPGGVREVDARGRWVTPGIIDVHSHDGTYVQPLTKIDHDAGDFGEDSEMNAADEWIESGVNVQDPAFSRALEHGVTMIQILPGSSPIFGGHSVIVRPIPANSVAGMKVPGAPMGFKMSCGENPKEEGAETKRGPTSRSGVVAFTRQALSDARDYLEQWNNYRLGRGPKPRRDLKKEALAGILAGDTRVHIHCYRADDLAIYLAMAREFNFHITAFHHAVEAYKIPQLLHASGTCALVWGDWWGFKMEALDGVRANAPLLDRAGVCVGMHSDSPEAGQRLNLEAAKAIAAGRRAGIDIPAERAIRWTTSVPAAIIGLDKKVGTLAPGFGADVVLWSGDPFSVYSKADLVLIDGGIVFDRAKPHRDPVSDFELGRPTMDHRQ